MDKAIETKTKVRTLCVNALVGIEFWFCQHYNGKITPGTETLNSDGECGACGKVSVFSDNPPSWMLPDADL